MSVQASNPVYSKEEFDCAFHDETDREQRRVLVKVILPETVKNFRQVRWWCSTIVPSDATIRTVFNDPSPIFEYVTEKFLERRRRRMKSVNSWIIPYQSSIRLESMGTISAKISLPGALVSSARVRLSLLIVSYSLISSR